MEAKEKDPKAIRLRKLREHFGLSRVAMSENLGMALSTYSMIERGLRNVTPKHIIKVCKEYGCRREWLEDGEGEMFDEPEENIVDHLQPMRDMKAREDSRVEALEEEYRDLCEEELELLGESLLHSASIEPRLAGIRSRKGLLLSQITYSKGRRDCLEDYLSVYDPDYGEED